jgi:hypothetical protein
MHGNDGNADRIGSFDGRSDGCVGEQASRERNRGENLSKAIKGKEGAVWIAWEFLARNPAGSRGVAGGKYL